MLKRLISRLWNRRDGRRRVLANLMVRAAGPDGQPYEVMSEDVSDSGIRLRFQKPEVADFMQHREQVPMSISLREGMLPVEVQARLVWTYSSTGGGTVSGWQFVQFRGRSRRRLVRYLDTYGSGS